MHIDIHICYFLSIYRYTYMYLLSIYIYICITYLAYRYTYMYLLSIYIYICITYLAYRYTYMLLIKQININTCNSFRAKLGQKILSKCRVWFKSKKRSTIFFVLRWFMYSCFIYTLYILKNSQKSCELWFTLYSVVL